MSKEEIIESLKDILDEINETSKDSFVDITYIKETIQDILNQNKDETRDDLLNLNPQKTSTPPLQKSKDLKDWERKRKKWKEQTKYLGSKTWKWWQKTKTKMTFVDYIIKERSRKFLSISLMDMEKSNYKGTLEEWFSDMYTEYKIINQNKDEKNN